MIAENKPSSRKLLAALLLWAFPLAFLLLFYFFPLAKIIQLSTSEFLQNGLGSDLWEKIWQPLRFTIWQAFLSTLLTLLLGMPAAYLFARYQFPGKSILRVLTSLPFILPTVVVVASFNALLGPRGWINLVLMELLNLPSPPINLFYTLPAILLAHVFYNTALVIRVVGSAWSQLDPRLGGAARVLGASPWRAFWEVTLPLLRPFILASALLVFLFDFTSFGVILLMGGPRFETIEVAIYIQAMQRLNLPLAGVLSSVQILFTLGITLLYMRLVGNVNIPLQPRLHGEGTHPPRRWSERLIVILLILLLAGLLIAPLAALSLRSVTQLDANRAQAAPASNQFTLAYYQELFINRRGSLFYVPPVEAVRNSLIYASATAVLSLILGFLVVYAGERSPKLNKFLEPVTMLPLGTSAVTLGLGFILVFNRPPFDLQSFPVLIPIAHSLVALPMVIRSLKPALVSIPPNLRNAARVLGAAPLRVWREVDLPILARPALVGAIFSFTISLGEFGATTFLSRPEYPTMPIAIYRFLSQPGALNYGQALAMSTLLLLACGLSMLLLEAWFNK